MKQIIKNLGALITIDVFLFCVFISRLLKMLLLPNLYRFFHVGYIVFLIFLALLTLLTSSKMPSTKEMTKAEKKIWDVLQVSTYVSLTLYLLWDLCVSGFMDNPLITNRVQVMMISVSLLLSISFIIAQLVFLKKYWRIPRRHQ